MKKLIIIAALISLPSLIFSQEKTCTLSKITIGDKGTWGAVPYMNGQIIFVENIPNEGNDDVADSKLFILDNNRNKLKLPAFEKYPKAGSPFISKDGKELYFTVSGTAESTTKGGWSHPDIKKYPLQILISKQSGNGEWQEPVPFQHNGENFSSGDPCLSPDGMYLYFASDRENGAGGTDIYRSQRNGDGSWSEPQNLRIINTGGDERFPRFDAKGNLYFSSTAGSAGDLDIFVFPAVSDIFTKPARMDFPFNSKGDDFAISFVNDNSGYLSSNRDGSDCIYLFEPEKPKIVYDTIKIIEKAEEQAASEPVHPDLIFADMIKNGKIKYVYFDFDKYEIRNSEIPALVELLIFMRQYPSVILELPSYADCHGSDAYNIQLSANRGEAVKNYLITHGGINASRITVKEYGAANPVNECGNCDNAKCSETEFEANRRVEYKILEY
ncbi:MAG: OmpA family protein [Prevotellaceae bacterium]|nr:OmpA family protein [Prevotellaceae bacterium]